MLDELIGLAALREGLHFEGALRPDVLQALLRLLLLPAVLLLLRLVRQLLALNELLRVLMI